MYPTQALYQPMPPRTKVPTWAKLLAVGIPVFVLLTFGLFLWLVPGSGTPDSAPAAADPVVTTASPVGPRGNVTAAFRAWASTQYGSGADFSMVTAVRTDAHGYGIAVETNLYPKVSNQDTAVRLCQVASMYAFTELGGFRTVWIGDQAGNVLVSRREVGGGCDWRR